MLSRRARGQACCRKYARMYPTVSVMEILSACPASVQTRPWLAGQTSLESRLAAAGLLRLKCYSQRC